MPIVVLITTNDHALDVPGILPASEDFASQPYYCSFVPLITMLMKENYRVVMLSLPAKFTTNNNPNAMKFIDSVLKRLASDFDIPSWDETVVDEKSLRFVVCGWKAINIMEVSKKYAYIGICTERDYKCHLEHFAKSKIAFDATCADILVKKTWFQNLFSRVVSLNGKK
jgi:hypothetical protein